MIGSEGTLGIVTRARLRLHPLPTTRKFAAYELPSFEAGADAMRALMQAGLRPAALRLYDPLDSFLLEQGKVARRGAHAARSSVDGTTGALLRAALRAPRALASAISGFEHFVSPRATLIAVFEGSADETAEQAARAARLLGAKSATSLGEAPARRWFAMR